jgi:hypothetical protein
LHSPGWEGSVLDFRNPGADEGPICRRDGEMSRQRAKAHCGPDQHRGVRAPLYVSESEGCWLIEGCVLCRPCLVDAIRVEHYWMLSRSTLDGSGRMRTCPIQPRSHPLFPPSSASIPRALAHYFGVRSASHQYVMQPLYGASSLRLLTISSESSPRGPGEWPAFCNTVSEGARRGGWREGPAGAAASATWPGR